MSADQKPDQLRARIVALEAELAAARQAEQNAREAALTASDAFFVTTFPEGRVIECHGAVERLLGYLPEELIGKTSLELGLYADPRAREEMFAALARDGHVRDVDLEGRGKGGQPRRVTISARIVEVDGQKQLIGGIKDGTEREAMLRYQQLLTRMLDEAPVGVIVYDEVGRLLYANQGASRQYGYPHGEMVGLPLSALVPAERAAQLPERIRDVLAGALTDFEAMHCRKDGSRFPLHTQVRRIDWLGQCAVLAAVTDLTERRKAEAQVTERVEFEILLAELSAVFGSAPVDQLEADLGEALRRVCDVLGISNSSLWLAEAAPPHAVALSYLHRPMDSRAADGRALAKDYFPWALAELEVGRSVHVPALEELPPRAQRDREMFVASGHGTSFTVPLQAAASTTLLGALVFNSRLAHAWPEDAMLRLQLVGGLFTSALHRKHAVQEVQLSAARFELLFQANPLPIAYSRISDGEVIDCNDAFLRLTGLARQAVLGKSITELKIWPSPSERVALVDRVLGGDRTPSEVSLLNAVGEPRTFLMSGVKLDVGGEGSLLMIAQDITEAKKASFDRDKLEEQLRHSQKMEAIGSLAGGVAHDFNNLLSVILSYTGFALSGLREGDPLRDDLLEVSKAGQRAVALTRQLLAFGRKQVLEPRVVDLNQICLDLEKMLRRLIGEDIELKQVLLPGLGPVQADPGQLEQVIMNLAVNARDAMPRGGRLTFETSNVVLDEAWAAAHADGEAGQYVQLAITDTGSGMDLATQQRVFEPFFTTKEKGKGTGLGLSMVYGIVHQSGGSVTLSSELGRGTTFRVYLPRLTDVRLTPLPSLPPTGPAVGHETVLLVEDEDGVRRAAARMLRSAGYEVLLAAHGGEALLTCEQRAGDIHLLLTDVVMPQMGGQQLAHRLTREWPSIKVLYMSGYTDDAIVHHGVLEPGTHFLVKPFDRATLLRKVRDTLDSRP